MIPPFLSCSTHTASMEASSRSIARLIIGLVRELRGMMLDLCDTALVSGTGYTLNSLPKNNALKNLARFVVVLLASPHPFIPGRMLVVKSTTSDKSSSEREGAW